MSDTQNPSAASAPDVPISAPVTRPSVSGLPAQASGLPPYASGAPEPPPLLAEAATTGSQPPNVGSQPPNVGSQPPSVPMPGDAATLPPPGLVESPTARSALRNDIVKLAGVYVAALFAMQLIVPMIFGVILVFADPNLRSKVLSGSGSQAITDALGSWMAWINLVAVLVGASLYFILRGRRLVTTDITTTIPVGGRWPLLGKAAVLILGSSGVMVGLNALFQAITGLQLSAAESSLVGSISTSVIGILYIVLIGPFLEEVIFRGAILRHLMPYGVNFAIVTQAVLFGLYHMNFYQGLFAFCVGLVLGYVASRFSLKWSFALHVLNNGLSMLGSLSDTWSTVLVVIVAVCAAGALAIAILDRQSGRPLITEGRSAELLRPFQAGWTQPFFLAVVIVVFLIGLGINMFYMVQ